MQRYFLNCLNCNQWNDGETQIVCLLFSQRNAQWTFFVVIYIALINLFSISTILSLLLIISKPTITSKLTCIHEFNSENLSICSYMSINRMLKSKFSNLIIDALHCSSFNPCCTFSWIIVWLTERSHRVTILHQMGPTHDAIGELLHRYFSLKSRSRSGSILIQ